MELRAALDQRRVGPCGELCRSLPPLETRLSLAVGALRAGIKFIHSPTQLHRTARLPVGPVELCEWSPLLSRQALIRPLASAECMCASALAASQARQQLPKRLASSALEGGTQLSRPAIDGLPLSYLQKVFSVEAKRRNLDLSCSRTGKQAARFADCHLRALIRHNFLEASLPNRSRNSLRNLRIAHS